MIDALPMALGIALSPFPVIPAIMLLFTARPRPTAGGFLLGWMLGVGAVVGGAALLAEAIERGDSPPTWAAWARLVLGAALMAYGAKLWRSRGQRAGEPAWMRSLQETTPPRALRLGVLLSAANPKVVLLGISGGLTLGAEASSVLAVAVFVAIASLTVATPLLAHLALGERVLEPLGRARRWLERNNDAVMAVVLVVIGAMVLAEGWRGV